mmetsp:Transcript_30384/g.37262  ORF Transcript_30384/g.37262 Transcript_30384/m.37262 type:complete len:214 (+) Transcript_30384:154-795(+)
MIVNLLQDVLPTGRFEAVLGKPVVQPVKKLTYQGQGGNLVNPLHSDYAVDSPEHVHSSNHLTVSRHSMNVSHAILEDHSATQVWIVVWSMQVGKSYKTLILRVLIHPLLEEFDLLHAGWAITIVQEVDHPAVILEVHQGGCINIIVCRFRLQSLHRFLFCGCFRFYDANFISREVSSKGLELLRLCRCLRQLDKDRSIGREVNVFNDGHHFTF